jgi:hypothetical protein
MANPAMTNPPSREQVILDALARELRRQDVTDVEALDLIALAAAIDGALGHEETVERGDPEEEGIEPDELNSANDL